MSTPNSHTQQRRRRLADQIANQLYTARLLGGRPRIIQRYRVSLAELPALRDLLTVAPQIAASRDPNLVRVAYMPSGALAVIRLHGPDWSLVLSSGRPMPDWLLAVCDTFPLHLAPPDQALTGFLQAFDLGADESSRDELTGMCRRIHAAIGEPAT